MIHAWRIGAATVVGVAEYYGPVHVPGVLYPRMDHQVLRDHRALLEGDHWIEAIDRLIIAVQIWVLHAAGRVILVDAGIGNGKPRTTPRANRLNTVALDWLAAAGAPADAVTDVVTTHLHSDHIGWNTRLEDDAWAPTFKNATYHLPRADYDWFRELTLSGRAKDGGSFRDSVEPVVDAGIARFVCPGDVVAGLLTAEAAFGHTPGHLNYRLESEGRTAIFSGDVLHHPVQIYRPDWNTVVDIEPERAEPTRHAFLARVAAADAFVMPCHFGPPHAGFVARDGDGYAFRPAPRGNPLPGRAGSPWTTVS